MTLSAALRRLILSDAQVKAITGPRVRPVVLAPKDAGAAIVYLLQGDTREITNDGPTGDGDVKLSLACRSRDYDQLLELRDRVVEFLNCFDDTRDGFALTIFYDDDTDDSVYEDEGDELPVFQQSADFNVMYRRTT